MGNTLILSINFLLLISHFHHKEETTESIVNCIRGQFRTNAMFSHHIPSHKVAISPLLKCLSLAANTQNWTLPVAFTVPSSAGFNVVSAALLCPSGTKPIAIQNSVADTEEHQSLIQTNIKVIAHYYTSLFTFCLILFYVSFLVYSLFGIKQRPERLITLYNSWPHFIRNQTEPRSAAGQSCVKDGNFISHRINRHTT